ncbi:methanethiol S-methyltransferase [Pelomonas cellulosilytica]|uniref:methanethiol S-methyltransferase n=1 Tax=Pelomonas cellulosilytica TaxID=2906762 RepID=A0ABS8XPI3_9BURK|nr:methanethiol S-methyltransferase [Pelomonas sp. P8]MCE4553053.1 isoprenylcysteine carboxylmethyltransferase family protein [Pelomonas sp. P8]
MLATLYAVAVYLFFLATMAFAVGFIANLPGLPVTLDRGLVAPLAEALVVDVGLLLLFAVQHSVMARRGFKHWWTRLVPPRAERATFVLASTAVFVLLMAQWRPIAEPVLWSVQQPVARGVLLAMSGAGWVLVVVGSWLIDHFEMFGLRQPWAAWRGHDLPSARFRTPLLYRQVRHPIYLGFLIAFWVTPDLTVGHALFAAGNTAYILVGVAFEERDLIAQFGERYRAYRERVGMLWPRLGARRPDKSTPT